MHVCGRALSGCQYIVSVGTGIEHSLLSHSRAPLELSTHEETSRECSSAAARVHTSRVNNYSEVRGESVSHIDILPEQEAVSKTCAYTGVDFLRIRASRQLTTSTYRDFVRWLLI